jgi:hypothetical protein
VVVILLFWFVGVVLVRTTGTKKPPKKGGFVGMRIFRTTPPSPKGEFERSFIILPGLLFRL